MGEENGAAGWAGLYCTLAELVLPALSSKQRMHSTLLTRHARRKQLSALQQGLLLLHTWAVSVAHEQGLCGATREAAVERLDGCCCLLHALQLHQRAAALVQLCAGEAAQHRGGEGESGKGVGGPARAEHMRRTKDTRRYGALQLAALDAAGAQPNAEPPRAALTGGSLAPCRMAGTSRPHPAACTWRAGCGSSCAQEEVRAGEQCLDS